LPKFGLNDDTYDLLCQQVDKIFHVGAEVNAVKSYSLLRASNVLGTIEILKLAFLKKMKEVNYVSTIGVCNRLHSKKEERANYGIERSHLMTMGGYNLSKYIAETKVMLAVDNGLPVIIYRPGFISSSETGACNQTDFDNRLLRGIILMKKAPYIEELLDMTPVDFLSKAIVYISQQKKYEIFHFANPTGSISLKHMIDATIAYGYPIEKLNFLDWKRELATLDKSNPIYPMSHEYFATNIFPSRPGDCDCTHTSTILKGNKELEKTPQITDKTIHQWLEKLCKLGSIPSPTGKGSVN